MTAVSRILVPSNPCSLSVYNCMKKLKRYQYERYAILCQLAYPDAEENYRKALDPFHERQLVDKYGRMSVRILWMDNKKGVSGISG